jgi:adenylate kinase
MVYETVLLFGPPGAGKSTWGGLLKQIPGLFHFSSGDMFRSLDPHSKQGEMALASIRKGELVPDEHALMLWRERMQRLVEFGDFKPDQQTLILDGLPRTLIQAQMANADLDVKLIMALDCPDRDLLVKRLYGRALIEHRVDDAIEDIIHKRFEVYDRQTADVLKHYPDRIVRQVDVSQPSPKILRDIGQALVDFLHS